MRQRNRETRDLFSCSRAAALQRSLESEPNWDGEALKRVAAQASQIGCGLELRVRQPPTSPHFELRRSASPPAGSMSGSDASSKNRTHGRHGQKGRVLPATGDVYWPGQLGTH